MTNEAGILLMDKGLAKYAGDVAVIGSAGACDSWLLAPDFCSADEQSRNLAHSTGFEYLSYLSQEFNRQSAIPKRHRRGSRDSAGVN